MRKGSDLIGKPVIAFNTGQQLERVDDLIFDQNTNQLLGLLVDEGGWFSTARVVPLQSVQSIGPDAVIVPSPDAVVSADQVPSVKAILERNNILKGTKMMTTDGRDLGQMVDLYFDEKTGVVEGYEVSGGIFADAYSGRSFVPAPQTFKIGEDVAFVPPETADLMEEQVGGIKGAAQTAGEKLQDVGASATAAVTNAVVDPAEQRAAVLGKTAEDEVVAPDGTVLIAQGQQVTPLVVDEAERQGVLDWLYRATGGSITGQIGAKASDAVSGIVAKTSVEQTRGRRVQRTVRSDDGMIIAATGQIVTEQVINRARTFNVEGELLEATGLSATEAARGAAGSLGDRISGGAQSAGDRLREGTAQAKEGTSGLLDRVKEKFNNFQERTSQELEEQRIKRALGRPVDRVILDPQDNVILNVGELITHQAVERSRQVGVLDILLSSVSTKDPEISQEELRAPEPGEAALPRDNQIGA